MTDPVVLDRLRHERAEDEAARKADAIEREIDQLCRSGFFNAVAADRINELTIDERAEILRSASDTRLAALFNLAFRSGKSGVIPREGAERDMEMIKHFVIDIWCDQFDAGVKCWREEESE